MINEGNLFINQTVKEFFTDIIIRALFPKEPIFNYSAFTYWKLKRFSIEMDNIDSFLYNEPNIY